MSFLDSITGSLRGALGQSAEAAAPALIAAVLAKTNLGGLEGIVNQLQMGGLGDQVKSWLGNGPNQPISTDQIRTALGSEQVKELAAHFGVPIDTALNFLTQHLPATVDQASPNGTLG